MCSLCHGVGLFSLIFHKRKRATASKVLEKRETLVSVTSSSFSALLDMLRNSDKSGRLLTVARGAWFSEVCSGRKTQETAVSKWVKCKMRITCV